MSNHVTITGRLGADPEIRFTASGQALCNVRIVDQERRKNDQTGQWEDAGEPLWLGGTIWGAKGEAFGNVARKGDLVTLIGRLQARSWDDKQTGEKRTVTEIKVFEAAVVPKVDKPAQSDFAAGGGWGGGTGGGSSSAAGDGWAQQPAQSQPFTDEPPF